MGEKGMRSKGQSLSLVQHASPRLLTKRKKDPLISWVVSLTKYNRGFLAEYCCYENNLPNK